MQIVADKNSGLAFDKASARSFDKDGHLFVESTNISKANVCPYAGKEIPDWQNLGLDANKVYYLYRDPEELAKGASTFRGKQLLMKHIPVSADEPQKEVTVGSIGSDVEFVHPYLKSSLSIWDGEAIALVESDKMKELSSGYRYRADMTPGTTPDGERFDGVMRDIQGNHVALVEQGRAGSDVVVADELPQELAAIVGSAAKKNPTAPKKEANAMKKTKLGKALFAVLSAASPKIAQDSALLGLVGGADRGTLNAKELAKQVCAMDEDLQEEKVEEAIEAVADVDQPVPKEPDSPTVDEDDGGAKSKHAEIIDYLRSKGLDASDLEAVGNMLTREERPFGKDEDVEKKVEEEVKTAMDSMRAEFKALETAKHAVRGVVGDVIGMDSAEDVYRFALNHMKVDNKGIAADGLPAVFAAIQATKTAQPAKRSIAMDSAAAADQFPGLARFN